MTSRTGTGEEYNRKWGIGAKQARTTKMAISTGSWRDSRQLFVILRAMSFSRQKKSINGWTQIIWGSAKKNATSATEPPESPAFPAISK